MCNTRFPFRINKSELIKHSIASIWSGISYSPKTNIKKGEHQVSNLCKTKFKTNSNKILNNNVSFSRRLFTEWLCVLIVKCLECGKKTSIIANRNESNKSKFQIEIRICACFHFQIQRHEKLVQNYLNQCLKCTNNELNLLDIRNDVAQRNPVANSILYQRLNNSAQYGFCVRVGILSPHSSLSGAQEEKVSINRCVVQKC